MTSIASSETGPLTVEPLSERNVSRIPLILPHERVFPIQIGSELFKLSGASLSSDGKTEASIFFATMHHVEERETNVSQSAIVLFPVLCLPIGTSKGTKRRVEL